MKTLSDGGWLKSHPLPADKGAFGSFETLAQQNQQVLQQILEAPSTPVTSSSSPDDQLLAKVRGMYASCLNEDQLDKIGAEPLLHFVQTLRNLFRGKSLEIKSDSETQKNDKQGLTAALAFLHSRGVDALFEFGIEGDVGVDPNLMTLWFNQPSLGLPSKVCGFPSGIYPGLIANLYKGILQGKEHQEDVQGGRRETFLDTG